MTSAGVGVAVHLDGFTAAGLAAHRALAAAGTRTAKIAIVFAGIKHDDDEYAGVLSAVRRTLPDAKIIGCSATGVLAGAEEVENANAVAVQVLVGDGPQPTPLFLPGVRGEPRSAGAELGQRAREALGDPLTITAAEGNLILEIEGRPAVEALDRTLSDPRNPGLRQMTPHLLAGIGELGSAGRSNYVVRPFAVADGDRAALAVAEPVRSGQTICFLLRDA